MLLAACYGYITGLEQDLSSKWASVDAVDNHQWTALHWAAYFAQTAVINLLLQNGADSTKRDWQGWNAYDVALFVGHDIPVLRVDAADTLSDVSPGVRLRGACDVCGHVCRDISWNGFRTNANLVQELVHYQHHCQTCEPGYDLCFRCFRDAEVVHAGHDFTMGFRY
jgi:hypothetical protein